VLGLLLLATMLPSPDALSQVNPGASLTVVRGMVAVTRPDGTAVFPAGTGLTLALGDIVGTLDRTRAIVTFFSGSEIELGSNTSIVIRRLDRDLLDDAQVTVENISGLTVIRVTPGSPVTSAVRVVSGDTVAVVHSGEVGHGVNPDTNNVTVACVDGSFRCTPDGVAFPNETAFLVGQLSRTKTGRGDLIDQRVPSGTSVWDALADGGVLGQQEGSSSHHGKEQADDDTPNNSAGLEATATPTLTRTLIPTTTATVTPTPTATGTATPPGGTPGPPCGVQRNDAGGSGDFTTVHSVGRTSGTIPFSWDAFNAADDFQVFYQGTLLFDTGLVQFTGSHAVPFGPGASTFITVVVHTGPGSTMWNYTVGCVT
jgi:hypothetical protein